MKALHLICTGMLLLAFTAALAQKPAPPAAGGESLEPKDKTTLEDPNIKLDDPKNVKKVVLPDAPAAPAKPSSLPGLEKLTDAQRKTLLAGMGEVAGYLKGVRWQEALEKLNDMEAVAGPSHYIENLRGAVFTRMRNFPKARDHFSKALELAKNMQAESFHPKFNIAELDFVTKQWDSARTSFEKLLKDPGKPGTSSDTLIQFKIMVCDLQQKKEDKAKLIQGVFDQYDADSPAYYYGNAAIAFSKDDKEGANEWLESARRIYPKEINEVFNDSLVEMGWLETLQ